MTDQLRLVLVCQESPWPARHGGTVDMFRRLQALHASGVRVFLIAWSESPGDASTVAELGRFADRIEILPYQRGFLRRLRLAEKYCRYPVPVVTRWTSRNRLAAIEASVKEFGAAHIMQDGLMAGGLARKLAKRLGLRLLVRSHNIEHLYWRDQAERATGLSWLKIRLRLIGLKRFELNGLRLADRFFDISADDLLFWQERGARNGLWLPPIVATDIFQSVESERTAETDLAFVGNLRMPNNIEGVRWLLKEVLPRVASRLGRPASVLVAGSAPIDEVVRLVETYPQARLRADFDNLADILISAKVLVNPMLAGSGVALKTVDMLLSGRPVVSTSQGVAGLPANLKALVVVKDDVESFADALYELIVSERRSDESNKQREVVSSLFGPASIFPLLEVLGREVP